MWVANNDMPQKPTIPEVIDRFYAYFEAHPTWGALHIVLDDDNLEDSSVDFCIEWAERHDDTEGAELGRILRRMSRTQRGRISHICTDRMHGRPS